MRPERSRARLFNYDYRKGGLRHRLGELTLKEQGLEVSVVDHVRELVGHVAIVDVDRDRANLEAPEQTLDELDAVAHVQSNVIAGPDTDTRQVAGDAIRALVQLDVCATTTIAHERRAVRNQIRDALVQICQIQ